MGRCLEKTIEGLEESSTFAYCSSASNNMHTGQNIFVNTVYSAVNKYSWRTRRMSVALAVPLDKMRTRRSTGIWGMAKTAKSQQRLATQMCCQMEGAV